MHKDTQSYSHIYTYTYKLKIKIRKQITEKKDAPNVVQGFIKSGHRVLVLMLSSTYK